MMPPVYRYHNWNLAAIKGSVTLGANRQLIYGNTGIWETDSSFHQFTDFNKGLGTGTDQRKTFTVLKTSQGRIYAGTLFGLYNYDESQAKWLKTELPESNPRVVKLAEYKNKLFILTRNHLFAMGITEASPQLEEITIPIPENTDGKAGLFTTLWVIHSGELLGIPGKLLVDFVGLLVIFFAISGFYYTLLPGLARKTTLQLRLKLQKINRFSINWHTKIGVYSIVLLIITVLSGMFLRPPLLIPIANSRVNPIPGTILDNHNHWHDKLRDFVIDTANQRYIFSTSEGFYALGLSKNSLCQSFEVQPPVSVMGITAFDNLPDGGWLVGSFSGLYRWYPEHQAVMNLITGQMVSSYTQGNPFGATAVSGLISTNNQPVAFIDYNAGWIPLQNGPSAPAMPDEIKQQPISLWNFALELHTGRIFSVFLGDFYILYVPLMGLATLLIFITGFLMWYKALRRKNRNRSIKANCNENHQTARSA